MLENLDFFQRMHGIQTDIHADLAFWDMEHRMKYDYKNLSNGEKQKVCLIFSLLHQPQFVVWDEPEASLDSESIQKLVSLVEKKKETTFLISTHRSDLFEPVADTVYRIKNHHMENLS